MKKKQEVKIGADTLIEKYNDADDAGKQLLQEIYGSEMFERDDEDSDIPQLKSWADVLKINKLTAKQFAKQTVGMEDDEIAYRQLKMSIKAFNGKWTARFDDDTQDKYFIWTIWDKGAGRFVFDGTLCHCTDTRAGLGPRLCFKSDALATHVGGQAWMMDIYNRMMAHEVIKKKKGKK